MKYLKIIFTIFIIISTNVYAAESYVLNEKTVIDSAQKHYPKILSYYEKVAVAEGGVLENHSFFDIRLKSNYSDKSRGFYDGKLFDSFIEKQNSFLNSKVYGGYRRSNGDFPAYEGGSNTNSKGEYYGGVKFSLLRDATTSKPLLDLALSKIDLEASKIQLENMRMEIKRDAVKSYFRFVADGYIYKIHQELYDLAKARQQQLEVRFKKGDIAQITLVENRRNVLARKNALLEAKRNFENSALYLSLFLRDENSNPIIADFAHLEKIMLDDFFVKKYAQMQNHIESDIAYALENRAEMRLVKLDRNAELKNLEYGKNTLKPKLDADFSASKDVGEGPQSRSQTVNVAKVNFEFPLQQSEGKGKVVQSQSKLSAIKYEEKLLREKIAVEIRQINNSLKNLTEIYKNLKEEIELCQKLEDSEHERLRLGDSNFFLINMREIETANAKINQMKIFEKFQDAAADYEMAVFR